ncbi:hypothetical protein LY624_20875 [Pseudoalteromonas sp. N1230-9]|jgi:hypothetical protein|uniref:hypothetical protein n=1 Tax=unclassified Pseudoalteromonas TaxID=194690 RepID=UPI0010232F7A|nr:hypothetical protein EXT42_16495 [Pseudoalteromonas sp. CO302Y]RZG05861.1 hypothetical protein EXT40_16500 [Pseudoalteromonas sp. CO133X]WOC28313.1 hypothetical protein LY624_20790 [Pseudoalteromonas sp. N1230-9]WOC28327.1 hypothetical protein LY624_20875 [Pseudoalteromonas sp. N1230-9]
MEQQHQQTLTQLVNDVYNKPDLIEEHQPLIEPLLTDLVSNAPSGFEGMAAMINTHISNGFKFKNPKIQQFELESGLLKLKTYFQKINL